MFILPNLTGVRTKRQKSPKVLKVDYLKRPPLPQDWHGQLTLQPDLSNRIKFYPDLKFALFWKQEFASCMGHHIS